MDDRDISTYFSLQGRNSFTHRVINKSKSWLLWISYWADLVNWSLFVYKYFEWIFYFLSKRVIFLREEKKLPTTTFEGESAAGL